MNGWLGASLDTGDVISHWVQAGFSWVDFDDLLKLGLASLQLVLPLLALWLALLQHQWLGVLTSLDHRLDV